jgi:hypothetical protein
MQKNTYPAIIVVAYNRDNSLARILESLNKASYPRVSVQLVISIDKSDNAKVFEVADTFTWVHGEKKIIAHENNMGLRNHILACGGLSDLYEAVIVLEDDLIVSPAFYWYAFAVLNHYNDSPEVSGHSLYNYQYNQSAKLPHSIITDGFDTYFMMVPSSSGQMWSKVQWNRFMNWYNKNQSVTVNDFVPLDVAAWPETSWKKYFWKYLAETRTYFTFPTSAYSTNSGDIGSHHALKSNLFQVDLSLMKEGFNFPNTNSTINVYDQFFELLPSKIMGLEKYNNDVEIDLLGTKPIELINKKYCISSKKCNHPIESFDIIVFPVQLNLLLNNTTQKKGGIIKLAETQTLSNQQDERFIEEYTSRLSGKISETIAHRAFIKCTQNDEYLIGHRILKLVNYLPKWMNSQIRKLLLTGKKN